MDDRQFDSKFYRMWEVNRDKKDSLKELLDKIDDVELSKLEDFSDLISNLFTDYDVFDLDSTLREDSEIFEEELRNYVKKTLLEIKDRYP